MRRSLRAAYHFLGGIPFTLVLIASVAVCVIVGTFIESFTQSHRYAADFTYSNPLFGGLLWGFFINILFSATRRWPFQIKHIPFLTTHLGLLMILSGVLVKHYFGSQGSMSVIEGSGAHEVFQLGSYALQFESRDGHIQYLPLKQSWLNGFSQLLPSKNLSVQLIASSPHSKERLATWVKNGHFSIQGFDPMPVHSIGTLSLQESIPLSGKIRFSPSTEEIWHVYAMHTVQVAEAMRALYLQETKVRLTHRLSNHILGEFSLKEALDHPVEWHLDENTYGQALFFLHLNFSSIEGLSSPQLTMHIQTTKQDLTEQLDIPLNGEQGLLNINRTTPYLGQLPIAIDLFHTPSMAIIEDSHRDIYLAAINSRGEIWCRPFLAETLDSLVAYENGFSGYAVQTHFPFHAQADSREQREEVAKDRLAAQLKQAIQTQTPLSPPLRLLALTCAENKQEFADKCMTFLTHWEATRSWLYPQHLPLPKELAEVFAHLNWAAMSPKEQIGCQWAAQFFTQIEADIAQGKDILTVLRAKGWPLIKALEMLHQEDRKRCSVAETEAILTLLTQQIFAAADLWSETESPPLLPSASAAEQARWLSAYFRVYGIHLSALTSLPKETSKVPENPTPILLETAVVAMQQSLPPTSAMEENLPRIMLQVNDGSRSQTLSLTYNRYGNGLKWPILHGTFLIRFQPLFQEIPYHVRLRQARQINYPNTSQPYSFESDLIITDRRTGLSTETTISMNNVYETWDGYRFYLASISPFSSSSARQVQIVVNQDPAKYWLTYPGALILSCGILLLFWMRPYKNREIK